jgi:hypothetical protein
VCDGNYSKGALPSILPRATDVIWLDYPRFLIMARVIRRSIARAIDGQELWPGTGNREDFGRWLQKDHPIRWTWDTYRTANEHREALFSGPDLAHARRHRFSTPSQADVWLSSLGLASQADGVPGPKDEGRAGD